MLCVVAVLFLREERTQEIETSILGGSVGCVKETDLRRRGLIEGPPPLYVCMLDPGRGGALLKNAFGVDQASS